MVAFGNFFFRTRNALFPVIMALFLLFTRPHPALSAGHTGAVWLTLGAFFALLGEAVRLFTIGFRYIERGGRGGKVYASKLVTGGLFSHTRNPMYVGNLLIVLGLFMFSGSVLAFAVGVPIFLYVYLAITAAEEAYLQRSFGQEYTDYTRRVPRFFPRLGGIGETLSSMHFEWKRSLRKDYGTMMTVALCLIWFPVWRAYFMGGTGFARLIAGTAASATGVAAAVYVSILVLKKAGKLADDVTEAQAASH